MFDDKVENTKLKCNVPIKDVRFINCNGYIEDGNIILNSTLYPYEFAGIEIKYKEINEKTLLQ